MVSIIIAAHNEATVIGATLEALTSNSMQAEIIVAPNGCTDDTAAVARSYAGVTVVEVAEGSKPKALNAGEAVATSWPRIYLDADILVPPDGVRALVEALDAPGILAAVPGRDLDTTGRPWAVKAYSAIHRRLPVFRDGLFGRGMIALSRDGRSRFDTFPIMVADDLFLDSLFETREKAHVESARVVVGTPFTTRDLMRRLVRVRRGSTAMRRASRLGEVGVEVRQADRWSWLRDVVAKDPLRLAIPGIAYAVITLLASLRARRGSVDAMDWGRDESTRR